jgi:hypothetical protein
VTSIAVAVFVLSFNITVGQAFKNINEVSFIFFIAAAGIVYLGFFFSKKLNVEYEYLLTNEILDIDKIISKNKRKRIISVNLKNIEIMAPARKKYAREYNNSYVQNKIYTGNLKSPDVYFIIVRQEKIGLTRVVFEPNKEIVAAAKTMSPRKVNVE